MIRKHALAAIVFIATAAWTPAGTGVSFDIDGTIAGTLNGEPIAGAYFGVISFAADFSADLLLLGVPPVEGTWKHTGEFTWSANFAAGIEQAFETLSGEPAKVDVYKFTKIVQSNGYIGGAIRSKFKWVAPKFGKSKFNWRGFIGGTQVP